MTKRRVSISCRLSLRVRLRDSDHSTSVGPRQTYKFISSSYLKAEDNTAKKNNHLIIAKLAKFGEKKHSSGNADI